MHKQQFEADMRPDEIKADCLRAITQQDVSTNNEVSLKVFGNKTHKSVLQIKAVLHSLREDEDIKHTRGVYGVDEWWLSSTVIPKKRGIVNIELILAILSEKGPALDSHAIASELFEKINPKIISRTASTLNQMCRRGTLIKHNISGLSYFAESSFTGDFNDYKTKREVPEFKVRSKSAPGYKEAPEVVLKRSQLMNQAMEFHKIMSKIMDKLIASIVSGSDQPLTTLEIKSVLYKEHKKPSAVSSINIALRRLMDEGAVKRKQHKMKINTVSGSGSTAYFKYEAA